MIMRELTENQLTYLIGVKELNIYSLQLENQELRDRLSQLEEDYNQVYHQLNELKRKSDNYGY